MADPRCPHSAAAADAVQEVLMMGRQRKRSGCARTRLVARQCHLPAVLFAQDHHALGAVEGVAVLVAFLEVRRPNPLFEDQLPGLRLLTVARVLEHDVLRVGPLLVVVKEVLAALLRSCWAGRSAALGRSRCRGRRRCRCRPRRSRTTSGRCCAACLPGTGTPAGPSQRSKSKCGGGSLGGWCPILPRRWLFQALATSTSPITPSFKACMACMTCSVLRD